MAQGGRREGAGRPKGSLNKRSKERAEQIAASGLQPVDYMIGIMRDEKQPLETRMEAAKSVAPYVHARLQATELTIDDQPLPSGAIEERLDQMINDAEPKLQMSLWLMVAEVVLKRPGTPSEEVLQPILNAPAAFKAELLERLSKEFKLKDVSEKTSPSPILRVVQNAEHPSQH